VSLPSLSSLVRGRDWIQGRNWKIWTGIAVTALAAVQLYFVREMLAALFIFTIVFAFVATVFLMLWLVDRAGQRTLAWAEPQTRELARLARRGVAIAEELGKKWTHTGAAHS
jgi:Flp pilus assembly protein TadB